jgi:DNA-binding NarL/FixJ family response regulator
VAQRTRVLVLSDDPLLGRGVAVLLQTHARFDAVWVESFSRGRRLIQSGRADVVVWLGDRLDADVVERVMELRRINEGTGLCILAQSGDPAVVQPLLAEGAKRLAVLLRTPRLDVHDLIAVVRGILRGHSTLEPRVIEQLMVSAQQSDGVLGQLTRSEREILALLSEGLRNREIARRLWKSEKAVEKQVSHLFIKLGLAPGLTQHLDRRVTATRIYLSESSGVTAGRAMPRAAGSRPL